MAGGPGTDDDLAAVLRRAAEATSGGRREGDDVVPLGPKAAKTRSSLLAAAYQQLVERGYSATAVEHVHEAAGVSLGTFYQYFRDKADVMRTLVGEAITASAPTMFRPLDLMDGHDSVRNVIEGFVRSYAATAPFQRLWEEATHVDDDLAALRRDVSRLLDAAVRDAIIDAQKAGVVDPNLDAERSSRALSAMVDRTCYVTFVVEDGGVDATDEVIETLVRLWVNALQMRRKSRA